LCGVKTGIFDDFYANIKIRERREIEKKGHERKQQYGA
jgi:hypothetical protein